MKNKLEVAVNLLLGLAAITVLYGYVGGSGSSNSKSPSEELEEEDWRFASRESRSTIGNAGAKHRLVIFTDFQCPFCRDLHDRLDARERARPGVVSVSILHYPIRSHKYATDAAAAFECVKGDRLKRAIADLLYEKQDSIGLIKMSEFAARVGSSDASAFEQCVASTPAAISAHFSFGEKLGIAATPTVLLDGRRLSGPPTDELLDRIYGATAK
ncbi:DsbA family protein [Gemmatimonas sp.]